MRWYIDKTTGGKQGKNAAEKAPADISVICRKIGMERLPFPAFPAHWKQPALQKAWILTIGTLPWIRTLRKVKKGDTVLLQYPFYGNRVTEKMLKRLKKQKQCNIVILIHDLESLRSGIAKETDPDRKARGLFGEQRILPLADAIICHNERMKEYLISTGLREEKLVCLKIFDYLTDCNPDMRPRDSVASIAIAGNLNRGKCPYIYEITADEKRLQVHLFGVGYDGNRDLNGMTYHGSFMPEELPDSLKGNFGLVWDGTSAKTCEGSTGNYLRYNNPHKTSLYLASNMPVIVWKEAAIASYVREMGVGIVVSSIDDIPDSVLNVKQNEWNQMMDHVALEGKRLRNGFYTMKALREAFRISENNDKEQ